MKTGDDTWCNHWLLPSLKPHDYTYSETFDHLNLDELNKQSHSGLYFNTDISQRYHNRKTPDLMFYSFHFTNFACWFGLEMQQKKV